MSTFGLVHGGAHGAWCWELVAAELERRGHAAVTVDLPVEDPTAGALEYARVAAAAFAGCPDDLVVVGHSLAGLVAPLVATLRPVGLVVFLCAPYPLPGTSLVGRIASSGGILRPAALGQRTVDATTGRHTRSADQARWLFYHDVPPDLATLAVSRLREQSQRPMTETTPMSAWPDVPRAVILARDDRCIDLDWMLAHVADDLGVQPAILPGSHSPFLARPVELVDLLESLAGR